MQPKEALAVVERNLQAIEGHKAVPIRKGPKPSEPLRSVDALAIFKREYPEPVFLIDGILANGVTLCAGRPKVGKSWLTLQIAIAISHGAALFGDTETKQGGVTYLALEEPESRTHHRLRRMVHEATPFLQNIQFIYKLKPLLAGGAAELDAYLTSHPSRLVIIDTLLAVVQNRNNRDVMRSDYAEVNIIRELAEKHGAAFLVVAHSRKAAADYHVDSVAGTSGLTAACDAIWSLTRKTDGTGHLEVTGRELEQRALTMRFNSDEPFGWVKTGEGEDVQTSEAREDVITLLREDAPLKPVEIARRLHRNENTVRRLLQNMVRADQVRRNSDGRYSLASADM